MRHLPPTAARGPLAPPPSVRNGFVTFGSLNNFAKFSQPAIDTWIRLLQRVPNSRLILHAHEGSHRHRLADLLASQSIDPDRLEFVGFFSISGYLAQYARIDVALDPFPYGGGHTTFDALWMGVPVVTLAGDTGVGRGGVSILWNLGKPQWIADSIDRYIEIAISLTRDIELRAAARNQLRDWMLQSPLMDAASHAQAIESAYRRAWRTCSGLFTAEGAEARGGTENSE
jgi:predicted O-linked N-acetylglucosamine transferase (SPINDLY family)